MPLENKWLFSFWSVGRDKCLTWHGGLVYIGVGMQPFHTWTISSSPFSIHSSVSSSILPSLSQIETSRVPVGDSVSCFDSGNPPPQAKATSTSLHHPGLFHALSDFWRLTETSYIGFGQLSSLLWDQNIFIPFPDFHWDLWGKKINLWPQHTSLNGRQGHSHMFLLSSINDTKWGKSSCL